MSQLMKTSNNFSKDLLLKRILTKDDYRFITKNPHKYFSVVENVVCFFNGIDWCCIPLSDMLAFPVLYYDFWYDKDKIMLENSLVVCPITMRSMIYKGKIKIIDIVDDRLFLSNTDTNDQFFMDSPYTGHIDDMGKEKRIKSHVKRHEVKIMVLRDIFSFSSDPKYMIPENKERQLVYHDYYSNRLTWQGYGIYTTIHPKTIVHIVQHYSYSSLSYKYVVIVGKDVNKDTVTGYNHKLSGFGAYMNQYKKELILKKAFIYPIFWFMVERLYKTAKIIAITT